MLHLQSWQSLLVENMTLILQALKSQLWMSALRRPEFLLLPLDANQLFTEKCLSKCWKIPLFVILDILIVSWM